MKHLNRQDGIAQLLVVALVAVILVAVGLAVWQSQKAKNNQVAVSPTPTATVQASTAPSPTTPATANEIKVTELGFKMTLPAGLTDIKYVAQTNLPGSAQHPATYSTSSFSTR